MPHVLMQLVALYAHATMDLMEMESTAQVRSSCVLLQKKGMFPHYINYGLIHTQSRIKPFLIYNQFIV